MTQPTTATMGLLGCFVAPQTTDTTEEEMEEEPLECNYDKDVTYLYQAIEEKAFMAAIDFLESDKKEEIADQSRTWVTRYEVSTGEIRWSQLPLHAALIFKAPIKLIELLTKHYKKAVRCTDDQKMLPLHLAFRYGASDNVLHLLLKEFPEAINSKDHKDRVPLDFAKLGDSWKKGEIINLFVVNAKAQTEKKRSTGKDVDDSTKMQELAATNAELKAKVEALTKESAILQATPPATASAVATTATKTTAKTTAAKATSPKATTTAAAAAKTTAATKTLATTTTTQDKPVKWAFLKKILAKKEAKKTTAAVATKAAIAPTAAVKTTTTTTTTAVKEVAKEIVTPEVKEASTEAVKTTTELIKQ